MKDIIMILAVLLVFLLIIIVMIALFSGNIEEYEGHKMIEDCKDNGTYNNHSVVCTTDSAHFTHIPL